MLNKTTIDIDNVKKILKLNIKNYLSNISEEDKENIIKSILNIKSNYFTFNFFNLDNINQIEEYISSAEKFKIFLFSLTNQFIFDLNFSNKQWKIFFNLIYCSLDVSKGTKSDDRLYFSINSFKKNTLITFLNNNKYLLVLYIIILKIDITDLRS